MSVDNTIDVLFRHLQMNDLIEEHEVNNIIDKYPNSIYEGTVYRCIVADKVIQTDLWQSWTKDKDMAYTIVSNIRGDYQQGKRLLLKQQGIGVDIVKLLRILKSEENLTQKQKNTICKLLSNYSHEQEVLCRLNNNTYNILEN